MEGHLLVGLIIWYVVFVFSTTCHEASHALAGLLGGDRTAYEGGQVTLDPGPHIRREPLGMVVGSFTSVSLDPPLVFLLIFGTYAASGPAYWFWRLRRRRARHARESIGSDGDGRREPTYPDPAPREPDDAD